MPAKGDCRYTIEDCRRYAKSKGGKCLSSLYVSDRESLKKGRSLRWECEKGHKWQADFGYMRRLGCWCYLCSRQVLAAAFRLDISDVRRLAKAKGGRFLSKSYNNSSITYPWRCANGHKWNACVSSVKYQNTWCPYCSKGSGEECVRISFEKLFGRRFPKSKPKWLKSSDGTQLEFDGFNVRMALAFEHQGRQHYAREQRFFHKNRGRFERQVALDRQKSRLCKKHGIKLIRIREIGWKFPLEELQSVVIRSCRRLGIEIPRKQSDLQQINYAPAFNLNPDKTNKYIPLLNKIAKARGGVCLEKHWFGWRSGYRFRCNQGHEWSADASNIFKNQWCAECHMLVRRASRDARLNHKAILKKKRFDKIKDQIITLQRIAEHKGGRCLSLKWKGWLAKYKFICGKCGRRWATKPQLIINGSWCQSCSLRKRHARNRAKRRFPFPT